jgi:ketosteroid isomerase-like protein
MRVAVAGVTMSSSRRHEIVDHLHEALNRHDLDAFLEPFDPEYRSETPVHPARSFVGREQVRRNWSTTFESTPEFRADLLRASIDGETVRTEWRMYGTRTDGTDLDHRGVIVMGIPEERIEWGRIYLEPVRTDEDVTWEEVHRTGTDDA